MSSKTARVTFGRARLTSKLQPEALRAADANRSLLQNDSMTVVGRSVVRMVDFVLLEGSLLLARGEQASWRSCFRPAAEATGLKLS